MNRPVLWIILSGFLSTHAALSAVNPITVTFDSGNASFNASSSGTANYIVAVDPRVQPATANFNLSLVTAGTSSGLTATPITTGASACNNQAPVCGATFSLQPGNSCCLAFTLSAATPGTYSLQPQVSTTTAPAYSAKAPSALPILASGQTDVTVQNIYAQTLQSRVGYTFNEAAHWYPMLSPQSSWYWNSTWSSQQDPNTQGTASMAIAADGVMYQAVKGYNLNNQGQVISTPDGIHWDIHSFIFLQETDVGSTVVALYGDTLYVGTLSGAIVSSQIPNLSVWTQVTDTSLGPITALITDASGDLWVGTASGAVYTNQSGSFQSVANVPDNHPVLSLAVTTDANGHQILAASTIEPGPVTNSYYYDLNSPSPSWSSITVNGLSTGDTISVVASANNVLYAGSTQGNVYLLTPSSTSGTCSATQQADTLGDAIVVLTVTTGPL